MDLFNWIEQKFGTKIANTIVLIFILLIIIFFAWVFLIPNGICDNACIKEIDFFNGKGGNPLDPKADY